MKYLILFIILISISCKEKVQEKREKRHSDGNGTSINEQLIDTIIRIEKNDVFSTEKDIFFANREMNVFDFTQSPLSEDYKKIFSNGTAKYDLNDRIRKSILKTENYYKLLNYNDLGIRKGVRVSAILGDYDYHRNILLITRDLENDSLIDSKVIASIIGDGDDFKEIGSKFLAPDSVLVITKNYRLKENGNSELLETSDEIFVISEGGGIEPVSN